MANIKISGYTFEGPYYFDRKFDSTFACVYAIVENNQLIYVGITHDINERFIDHHKENCWRRNLTSTETLYILRESNQFTRESIESDIRSKISTPCNEI